MTQVSDGRGKYYPEGEPRTWIHPRTQRVFDLSELRITLDSEEQLDAYEVGHACAVFSELEFNEAVENLAKFVEFQSSCAVEVDDCEDNPKSIVRLDRSHRLRERMLALLEARFIENPISFLDACSKLPNRPEILGLVCEAMEIYVLAADKTAPAPILQYLCDVAANPRIDAASRLRAGYCALHSENFGIYHRTEIYGGFDKDTGLQAMKVEDSETDRPGNLTSEKNLEQLFGLLELASDRYAISERYQIAFSHLAKIAWERFEPLMFSILTSARSSETTKVAALSVAAALMSPPQNQEDLVRNLNLKRRETLAPKLLEPAMALLESPSLQTRRVAIQTITGLGAYAEAAASKLAGFCADEEVSIRCAAVIALGYVGSPVEFVGSTLVGLFNQNFSFFEGSHGEDSDTEISPGLYKITPPKPDLAIDLQVLNFALSAIADRYAPAKDLLKRQLSLEYPLDLEDCFAIVVASARFPSCNDLLEVYFDIDRELAFEEGNLSFFLGASFCLENRGNEIGAAAHGIIKRIEEKLNEYTEDEVVQKLNRWHGRFTRVLANIRGSPPLVRL